METGKEKIAIYGYDSRHKMVTRYYSVKAFLKWAVLLFFILLLARIDSVRAQPNDKRIDSLTNLLNQSTHDTTKLSLLFEIGRTFWFRRDLPQAYTYLTTVRKLSDEQKHYTYLCDATCLLGNLYMELKQFDSALIVLQQGIQCSEVYQQPEHKPKMFEGLSNLYAILGDKETAINYSLKAVDLYEKSEIPEVNLLLVFAYAQIGKLFELLDQWDKAIVYYKKSLEKALTDEREYYRSAPMMGLAGAYVENNQLALARKLCNEVLAMGQRAGGIRVRIQAWGFLGAIALKEKALKEAIEFFRKSYQTSIDYNLLLMADRYAVQIGQTYLLENAIDSATYYLQQGIDHAIQNKNNYTLKSAYQQMAALYEKTGNESMALIYQKHVNAVTDTISSQEKTRDVNNLEILYETERKENDIIALKLSNTQKELTVVKQNRFLIIGGIVALALLAIMGLLYRNSRQKTLLAEKDKQLKDDKILFLEHQQQVVSLQSMINGQETERTRIAKDLHDGLGGLFSTVKMHLSTLEHEQPGLVQNELFNRSFELINTASQELRRVAHNMMPEVLIKLGLQQAVQDLCNNINAGRLLMVTLQSYGLHKRLNSATEIMLFRIIQELLNNIIKHAEATRAIIQFNKEEERLTITVEDNGKGFNTAGKEESIHAGLETVKSRVDYLNGNISIDSEEKVGTTVIMNFLINE